MKDGFPLHRNDGGGRFIGNDGGGRFIGNDGAGRYFGSDGGGRFIGNDGAGRFRGSDGRDCIPVGSLRVCGCLNVTECQRFAGAHADAPEVDLAFSAEHVAHEIIVAHRDPANRYDQVAIQAGEQCRAGLFHCVADHGQPARDAAIGGHQRFQGMRRAVAHLARLQRPVYLNDFIAGGNYRHHGTPVDCYLHSAHGRQHADLSRPDCACRVPAPARPL